MNMKKILVSLVAGAVMTTAFALSAMAADIHQVANDDELEAALGTAAAGDTIILEAGNYQAFDLARNSALNFKGMDGATVIASDSNSCYWPCFTGTVENIVFKAAENYSYPYNYSAIIFAHDTNFGEPCDITFKNCDFISSNGNSGIHFVGDVDFYNCDFVGDNSYSAMNYCCPSGDGIVIDGCTFNGTYSFASIHLAEGVGADTTISGCKINTGLIEFGSPKNIEFSENVINSTINLWSENKVVFDNNEFGEDAKVSANSEKAVATILPTNTYADGMTVEDIVVSEKDGDVVIPVAKIGSAYYATLQDAITYAADGAVIDLLGNTFEISKNPGLETKHLTFKNGTMDFTNATSGDAFIWMSGDRTVAFEDMTLLIKDREEGAGMCYWMDMKSKNASASFIRCEIDFDAVQYSYISGNEPGSVYFENCIIEAEQANFVYRAAATFVNCTFDGYADLSEGESAGNIIMWASVPCVIDNSTVHTRSLTTISSNGTIAISNNSYVYAANVYDYYGYYYGTDHESYNTNLITVDSTSTLEAVELDMGLINEASTGKITSEASAVYVQYKKTDIDANGHDNLEGADTYEIVLLGANNTASKEIINELASADLTFEFVPTPATGAAMTYTVAPAKGVTLTQIENRYMFNYNGVDKYEESGTAIVIGTIEISGYGAYTFGTKDVDTNAVYATEIKDNIVDGFEPASGLVINTDMIIDDGMVGEIINGNIAVPTRTLIVNVAFPNAVVDNVAAYQDMKIEITGNIDGVNKTVTYDLGGNMTADGTYVVAEDRLVLNDAYTVTVSGAGYRTARYTVTMNCEESKTLNFWNNVKDNAIEVEVGKETSEKNVTFLAGDIVKDSLINIYDLSAVVSYFGEIMNVTAEHPYAKYDLNRDGKIDSKDVAYVLVSWNN